MVLAAFEWLAIGYFLLLAAAAPWSSASRGRQSTVILAAIGTAAVIGAVAGSGAAALRAWLPLGYLVAGYWLPARLAPAPLVPTRLERWLRRVDDLLAAHVRSPPGWATHALESAYLLCYPIVPAAFAVVWILGSQAEVDRFWIAVLASGYACYGPLPWFVSRPPRLAEETAPARLSIRTLNVLVLDLFSHGLNTFPSGHVAVSCAAAGAVTAVAPSIGGIVWGVAAAIAAGAVVGRYHYVADVILGAAVGLVGVALARLA